jgi:hypothetical protein
MRVLLVAPFERNLPHGGSLRATAMAERLEQRGATVEWRAIAPRTVGPAGKLRDLAGLRPALTTLYSEEPIPAASPPDAAIAAHSYVFGALRQVPERTKRAIDFHNLEWQHLADSARFEPPLRRPYAAAQVKLMRRFERQAVAAADLSLFVSETEREWALRTGAPERALLVPSVLPRAAEERALALGEHEEKTTEPRLGYVGTLRFPPNAGALLRFLRESWPAVRRAIPGVSVAVAGDADPALGARLRGFPGVELLGAVPDVSRLLRSCAAMLLPVDGQAGTSLRALEYSLAGVWAIGTPEAFRGIPWKTGVTVRSPEEWAAEAAAAMEPSEERERRIRGARDAALALQRDDAPWDRLADRIAA